MNLRASLTWGANWALLWLSNPKSWRLGEWKLASGEYPEPGNEQGISTVYRYWRVGPLELRKFVR